MQGPPFQKEIRLPYSKWSQHRADNGLIYLAHPITGEVKWLWSRHHDPKTEHDYLVNTITGKRQWVTKENSHFCPVKPKTQAWTAANVKIEIDSSATTNPLTDPTPQTSASDRSRSSSGANHFVNMPTTPAKVATAPKADSANKTKPKYREIAAPKSLGLTADEILMLVPETGRRYIFNKKTKTSRWLPDRVPDTIANERRHKPLFGRSKGSKQTSSPQNDEDDVHAELKMKTKPPTCDTVPRVNTSSSMADKPFDGDPKAPPDQEQAKPVPADRDTKETRHLNGKVEGSQASPPGAEDEDEDEVDEVSRRLGALNTILADVSKLTMSDKYNMAKLRTLSTEKPSREQAQEGSQRLLELEEYLTQQMLRVDAVESEGIQVIRAKRKETVQAILALTEEIERLREQLSP